MIKLSVLLRLRMESEPIGGWRGGSGNSMLRDITPVEFVAKYASTSETARTAELRFGGWLELDVTAMRW